MDGTGQLEKFCKHLNKQHPQIQKITENKYADEKNDWKSGIAVHVRRRVQEAFGSETHHTFAILTVIWTALR